MHSADRGIGGTGIIGVITGFGSLCVAGEKVALSEHLGVRIDDQPGDVDALRAGQVAAVGATDFFGSLSASSVDILHVAVGRVEAVKPGTIIVAGQRVRLAGATGSATNAKPGAWVAVSGLRDREGDVAATRVDPATPNIVLVRGELVRVAGATRIGGLRLQLPAGANLPGGWSIVVTGHIEAGVLMADSAKLDAAATDPAAYFGPNTRQYVVEGYVTAVPRGYIVNRTFVAGSGIDLIGNNGRQVFVFERGADGRLTVGRQPSVGRNEPSRGDLFNTPPPGQDPPNAARPADDGSGSRSGANSSRKR
jgi:hypothetical protein